jgi:hypothetical protein
MIDCTGFPADIARKVNAAVQAREREHHMPSHSQVAAKVAVRKRTFPHLYCSSFRCLWVTRHRDGRVTPCPKHANSVLPYPPECCQSCGAPFNNANPTPSGLCGACEA